MINNMDESHNKLTDRFRNISADIKSYIEKRLQLSLLNTREYFSEWITASIFRVAGALLLLVGICFMLVALAIYLGQLLNNQSLGYLLVSPPLLLAGGLFVYLKPDGLFTRLQHNFEDEFIKALNQQAGSPQNELESTNLEGSNTEDKS